MSRLRAAAIGLCLALVPVTALAQEEQTPQRDPQIISQATHDPPLGFPYNTGRQSEGGEAIVTLRDFMSSRQDQMRAELIERIDVLERQFRQILDERDKQYAQRFAAQQEALQAALSAAKEAVASALSAADRAVAKAEGAADKRFESDDQFRRTLTEQALTFVSKDTAEARFKALEDKAVSNSSRIDAIRAADDGQTSLWGFLIGAFGILIAFGSLMFHLNKSRDREHGERP